MEPTDVEVRKFNFLIKKQIPHDFIPINMTISALGDSLTKGVGDETNQGGYLHYLKSSLKTLKGIQEVSIQNFGIRGYRSNQLLNLLSDEKVQSNIQQADMVVFTIGANDLMKIVRENITHLSMDDFIEERTNYLERLNQIIKQIRSLNPTAPVIYISLYNPFISSFSQLKEINEIIDHWNSGSKEIINNYKQVYFVPIQDLFENDINELLFEDYFHPNQKGYELIGNRVMEVIIENKMVEWMIIHHDS